MTSARLGIYVHIPFCASRCHYCDFVSNVYDEVAAAGYLAALDKETAAAARAAGPLVVDTLYLGGGTPPALGAAALSAAIALIRNRFHSSPTAEVTSEANPESLTPEICEALLAAGANRLSLGVQTFDDAVLRAIGRRHDAAGAEAAFRLARRAGFKNVSLDLIYGLPGQTAAGWRDDLGHTLTLDPEHISLYALTLEPHVPLYRERRQHKFAGDDELADMYYDAVEILTAAGFEHYEISNFARAGRACRHNLKYWRDEEYLAFGPGAAAHWRGGRHRNPAGLTEYAAAAAAGRWPLVAAEPSNAAREMRTAATLGLRLTAGLDFAGFERRFGVNLASNYEKELAELSAAGLLEINDGAVRLTRRGLFLSDEVFARLI